MDAKQIKQMHFAESEGFSAKWRIEELEANPVIGNFDAAHLKEIHRRIFQDFPALGITKPAPGEFRSEIPPEKLYQKTRQLLSMNADSYVGYSWMSTDDRKELDGILKTANPGRLSKLDPETFAASITKLYAQLDYIHPFQDGNSRTLRTFTRQLARESGYNLDWTRFNQTPKSRDGLYIARDRAVSEIAMNRLPECEQKFRMYDSIEQFRQRPGLEELMRQAVSRRAPPEKAAPRHDLAKNQAAPRARRPDRRATAADPVPE
ncbi:MAG: Fic family protein [Candidatus Accumulibacter sp.]|jgi:cell filamentation protein|nr:Fic family protein [Accumulibacter sp.]